MASPLAELFSDLGAVFKQTSSGWYVFGAQAAIMYGAARLTADVDVTVLYGNRPVADLIEVLQRTGFSIRVENAAAFAERSRILPVVHLKSGLPVDIVFGGPGLEEEFMQRVSQYNVEGTSR